MILVGSALQIAEKEEDTLENTKDKSYLYYMSIISSALIDSENTNHGWIDMSSMMFSSLMHISVNFRIKD